MLLRHGETEWSRSGKHTGRTDVPLTEHGEELARRAGALVADYDFVLTLSSSLQRARRTAELAGLTPEVDDDLLEWDYGGYEGMTTAQIRERTGTEWTVFREGVVPGATPGETIEQVAARADAVLTRVRDALPDGDVVLVGHGHALRVLAARWLGAQPSLGAQLMLEPATVSVLGEQHDSPVLVSWNVAPPRHR